MSTSGESPKRTAIRIVGVVLLGALLAIVSVMLWLYIRPSEEALVFRLVAARPSVAKQLIQVAFGEEVSQAREYPASVTGEFQRLIQCSGTLVGPNTLLTAEHCVRRVARLGLPVKFVVGSEEIVAICSAWRDLDLALCKLTTPVSGIPFDFLATNDPTLTAKGTPILLTGWADSSPHAFEGVWRRIKHSLGFKGKFKVGRARIAGGEAELAVEGETTSRGPIALEGGDSGGAAYVGDFKRRLIIGVNRCGGTGCAEGGTSATSTLTNIVLKRHAEVILNWAATNGAQICGMTPAEGCRPQ